MSLDSEVQALAKVTAEQTVASQNLAQEVIDKMAGLDAKSLENQQKIDDFIGSDFAAAVNDTKEITVYIDSVEGDDLKTGLSDSQAIKSSDRLYELVGLVRYDFLRVYLRKGTEFILLHRIYANTKISLSSYDGGDEITDKPAFRQGLASKSLFQAPAIFVYSSLVYSYTASDNEELPDVYSSRAFFGYTERIAFVLSEAYVTDNQLFHIHNSGSGVEYNRRSISLYYSKLSALPSAINVINAEKSIYSWYGTIMGLPLDFFVKSLTLELNAQHADLDAFLNMPSDYIVTNTSLTIV